MPVLPSLTHTKTGRTEKIPFAKPGYGITLSIYSPSFYVPSPIDLYYKEYVDRLAQLVVLEKCDQVTHEAVQVGSHYVAKVGGIYTQKKMYTVIYQIPLGARTLLLLIGLSDLSNRTNLVHDMEQTIASLKAD